MAADFRFVADAAERDADELAVHRARDRLAERGLADARRADEAEDRPLDLRRRALPHLQLLHRQVLDDALLDLVEVVVILVEDRARRDRIEPILGERRPRDVEHPVEVGADHLVLGRRRRHPLQAIELALGDRRDRLGQLRLGEARAQVGDLGLLAFAELLLDRLELLAQVVLPLRVGHLLLRGRLDLALHLEQRDLAAERVGDRLQLRR